MTMNQQGLLPVLVKAYLGLPQSQSFNRLDGVGCKIPQDRFWAFLQTNIELCSPMKRLSAFLPTCWNSWNRQSYSIGRWKATGGKSSRHFCFSFKNYFSFLWKIVKKGASHLMLYWTSPQFFEENSLMAHWNLRWGLETIWPSFDFDIAICQIISLMPNQTYVF